MLSLTRSLLALRRAEPVLTHGAWVGVSDSDGVLVYERCLGEGWCRVALNMRPEPVEIECGRQGRVVVSTHGPQALREAGSVLSLAADEGLVILPA